ncbi:YadA-like family protein [Burkholderia gladioli]|uniref:YadA-like family protein n=1 Tax=Burkholderia gladioli TaxID=28095 RepID=UPI003BB1A240
MALGAGSIADQPNTVSLGSPGNERRLTNVAPGVNPTDGVNVSQLQSVQGSVNRTARLAYAGIASATALTMIPDVDPNATLAVGIGTGGYQGYQAMALGFTARVAKNVKIKGGVGMSGAGSTYGVGLSYQW